MEYLFTINIYVDYAHYFIIYAIISFHETNLDSYPNLYLVSPWIYVLLFPFYVFA